MSIGSISRVREAYMYEIIRVGAMEVWYLNANRQRFLSFESFVQTFTKVCFYAHRLKNKDAHADESLFGRVVPVLQCIKQYQYHKIV